MEEIELNTVEPKQQKTTEQPQIDNLDGDETTDVLGNNNPGVDDDEDEDENTRQLGELNDFKKSKNKRIKTYYRIVGERFVEALDIDEFLDDNSIDLTSEYINPKFIKYLMDKHNFQFKKTNAIEENAIDYEIEYYGKPYLNENEVMQRPYREFHIENLKFQTEGEFQQFKGDMKYLYDKWDNEDIKKRIKQAGLVGGILIAIAGLVSGLSLGLKRTGHNMIHDSKVKWKKLTPAEKKQIVIPWTEVKEASGKSVILIGDYLYVLIGGTILVYLLKK